MVNGSDEVVTILVCVLITTVNHTYHEILQKGSHDSCAVVMGTRAFLGMQNPVAYNCT